ncbi:MAG TPA: serine protease [Bacilli bacterium]
MELREQEFKEEEFDEPDFDEEEEEEELSPQAGRKWIKKTIAALLAFVLLGNILVFWPQVYSLPAIQFLKKSAELSKIEIIQQYKQAVVVVKADNRKGTGFNIDPRGYIITNHHIVEDEKHSTVSFATGETYQTEIVVNDPAIDIAILRIKKGSGDPELNLPLLEIEPNGKADPGLPVYIIGNPLFFKRIANEGSVMGMTLLEDWELPVMVIDAPIYRGNSGSPVINDRGKVIAVVFATTKIPVVDKTTKVGLATPIGYLRKYID